MNRWDGIHEFVQVVEAGSFTAAATRLGVSPSQISKLMARLEERLHVRLMHRSTRRIILTAEGELFYHRCKRIVESLDSAEEDLGLHRSEARGHLQITINSEIGETALTSLLARFLAEQPQLSMEVTLSNGRGDLIGPGHDLALWLGKLDDSSLIARKLCELQFVAVASPSYLARHGIPQHPDDLARHNCLLGATNEWTFRSGNEVLQKNVSGNWRSIDASVRVAAAVAGGGIALLPELSVKEAIAQQLLTPVLASWCQHREPLWTVYPQNRYLPARMRLLLDFLIVEFGDANTIPFAPQLELAQ